MSKFRRPARLSALALSAVLAAAGLPVAAGSGEGEPLPTPGEAAHYLRYTQNEEIGRFLSRLDARSGRLAVEIVGRSGGTTTYGPRDLFLCILTAEGATRPEELDRSKPTLFLFASQHGDEQSAKEAALALVRDLAVGDLAPLLARINLLVIPQVNPYGNRVDQRRNEQDLDLNRDHVKLEAPATRAVHRVFREWMPEVTVDAHEKGDDYYRASYGCVSNLNVHSRLEETCRGVLLAEVAADLEARGIPFHEYLVTQPMGIESAAGAALPESAEEGRALMKRYSTTDLNDGRNGLGIYETLSLIFEGSSRHDLETLGERTGWQFAAFRALVESVARHGGEIVELVSGLRRELLERAGTYSPDDRVHLRMDYARSEVEPTLTLREYAPSEEPILGVLAADKKAGEPLTRADVDPYPHPAESAVVEEVVENWFPRVVSTVSVARPNGYLVPGDRGDLVETLLAHGIRVGLFVEERLLPVEVYQVTRVVPAAYDYLAPEEIEVETRALDLPVAVGDFYVSTAQEAANLIPALLEPQSRYGLIRYRAFELAPGKGERFPLYRYLGTADLPLVPYKPWRR